MKLNKGFKVKMGDWESMIYGEHIVTGKQIGRAHV